MKKYNIKDQLRLKKTTHIYILDVQIRMRSQKSNEV